MTPADLELERLARAATPGPWTAERQDGDSGEIYYALHGKNYDFITNVGDHANNWLHDAAFIAAANPQAVLGLLARVRELEGALTEIAKGEGEYSRDPMEHAINTIDSMKAIATKAIRRPGSAGS